jgi:hypothetical protein
MALTPIDAYEVMYSANTFAPKVWLKHGNKYVCDLRFMPNGSVLPPDTMVSGRVILYYHLDDFHNAIDLLRNETPMYLLYSGPGSGFENGIRTLEEVVGEGEG